MQFDPTIGIVNIEDYDGSAQIGGLGRYLINNLADEWHYFYVDKYNISLLKKKINERKC